jgi:uncharacterized cofD-like protein
MSDLEKKKIVVIGGGTGTHTVLTGLKHYQGLAELTAIVAVTDSGGSTGRLRDEFGYLPVGDVRMALAALAKEDDVHESLIRKLFLHRFSTQGDVAGHNFGNLFLVALTDILGSEQEAIEAASRVLQIHGTVLPVTHEKTDLVAEYADGKQVIGEHEIDEPHSGSNTQPIKKLSLSTRATINPRANKAIRDADLIIFGPGDLYTSIIANCVVDGFKEALDSSKGTIVYVANLMTKSGQTSNMGVKEHVEELFRYTGKMPDYVLVNDTPLPEMLLEKYAEESELPVCISCNGLRTNLVYQDLLATEEIVRNAGDILKRSLIRHDSHKLARALYALLFSTT